MWVSSKFSSTQRNQRYQKWKKTITLHHRTPPHAKGTTTSRQLFSNESLARTEDRTCTQKLTIPSLEKNNNSSTNLWWQIIVHNVKMTKYIYSPTITITSDELQKYRDRLEAEMNDILLWSIGQNAITKKAKEFRALCHFTNYIYYYIFILYERNVRHSRADFLD